MNDPAQSSSGPHQQWPLPLLDRIEDRVRAMLIAWVTLWFATTVTLMALKRDHIAMPLMLVGIAGLLTLTRATKFLQTRMLNKAQRAQDQLCTRCGYYLTTDTLRCSECGNVYTLADTRTAWQNARELARHT